MSISFKLNQEMNGFSHLVIYIWTKCKVVDKDHPVRKGKKNHTNEIEFNPTLIFTCLDFQKYLIVSTIIMIVRVQSLLIWVKLQIKTYILSMLCHFVTLTFNSYA